VVRNTVQCIINRRPNNKITNATIPTVFDKATSVWLTFSKIKGLSFWNVVYTLLICRLCVQLQQVKRATKYYTTFSTATDQGKVPKTAPHSTTVVHCKDDGNGRCKNRKLPCYFCERHVFQMCRYLQRQHSSLLHEVCAPLYDKEQEDVVIQNIINQGMYIYNSTVLKNKSKCCWWHVPKINAVTHRSSCRVHFAFSFFLLIMNSTCMISAIDFMQRMQLKTKWLHLRQHCYPFQLTKPVWK